MRSLEKRKKGMGYENACLATEGRGTHFSIPTFLKFREGTHR